MLTYSTSIHIVATAEEVWDILVDVDNWMDWNPTVIEIEGTAAPDGKVKLRPKANPKRSINLKVTEFDAPTKMVWTGGMLLGLFKGERTFTIDRRGVGVEFGMTEVYSGPMAGMITRSIPDLQPSFDEFAAALKAKAEKRG